MAKRLFQLAKELGVGVDTLIDFFKKETETNIDQNTRLTDEQIKKAENKFKSDKKYHEKVEELIKSEETKKDKSATPKNIETSLKEKKQIPETPPIIEKKEPQITGPKILGKIDLEQDKKVKEKPKKEKEDKNKISKEPEVLKNPETVIETKTEETEQKILQDLNLGNLHPEAEKKIEEKILTEENKTIEIEQKSSTEIQKTEITEEKIEAEQKTDDVNQIPKIQGPKILGKLDEEQLRKNNRPEKKPKQFKKEEQQLPKKENQGPIIKDIKKDKFKEKQPFVKKDKQFKKAEKIDPTKTKYQDFKKNNKPKEPEIITEQDIKNKLKETVSQIEQRKKSDAVKFHREKREQIRDKLQKERERQQAKEKIIQVSEFISVKELSSLMGVEPNKIIEFCFDMGQPVNINFRLDSDLINMIAEAFNVQVEFVENSVENEVEKILKDPANQIIERAPIVTVMGHVDHGKTTLLDYIRRTNVASKEAGGITQHIGAYTVDVNGKMITFIDTPGHEAFTSMRAKGAKITDIAVIVVAADDHVMPQTEEAIDHAKAAGVSIIFAINKIDKNNSDPQRIRQELSERGILVEDWGGKYGVVEISAKTGINIDKLLERILFEAELLELKANPNRKAIATVIESKLDKGRGYVTNAIVRTGTLKVGDVIWAGPYYGKVRALFNDKEEKIKEAGPSLPVSILGLNGAPEPGESLIVMDSEKEASEKAKQREEIIREIEKKARKKQTLHDVSKKLALGQKANLNFIIKGDTKGSCDAISIEITKLSNEQVEINVIRSAVGQISESDVLLATASNAIIIGFNVSTSIGARKMAETNNIEIRNYSIIFDIVEDVKKAIAGILGPEIKEEVYGTAEVLNTFKIEKVGTVAGAMVRDGKIVRDSKVRIIRDGIVIYTGKILSLKRYKDDVREVSKGFDCGIAIENFNDIKIGDFIESFKEVEVERKI